MITPATEIACPRFEEMWRAVIGKSDELLRGARGSRQGTALVSTDGRFVSRIVQAGQDDGTDKVWEVTAFHRDSKIPGGRTGTPVQVTTEGPWIDSHDSFWQNVLEEDADRKNGEPIVVGTEHYVIMPERSGESSHSRGFGGRRFRIRIMKGMCVCGHSYGADHGWARECLVKGCSCHPQEWPVVETTNLWYQGVIPPSWREKFRPSAEFVTEEA